MNCLEEFIVIPIPSIVTVRSSEYILVHYCVVSGATKKRVILKTSFWHDAGGGPFQIDFEKKEVNSIENLAATL